MFYCCIVLLFSLICPRSIMSGATRLDSMSSRGWPPFSKKKRGKTRAMFLCVLVIKCFDLMTKKKKKNKYDDLLFESKSFWETASEVEKKKVFVLAEDYKKYLDKSKTERRAVLEAMVMAKKQGYREIDMDKALPKGAKKLIFNNRNKNLVLVNLGDRGIDVGVKMLLAHVDSPRLDLKVRPLYEDNDLAFFKTHYYGGIKKYQWPTIPLSMMGLVVLRDGKEIEFEVGEREGDPVFLITDLLPHLDKERMTKKTMDKAIQAEELNVLAGNIPVKDENVKNRVKLAVLEYLNKEYGIIEKDFFSADLRFVPSWKARDIGFDRSMVAGYGHDDKVCVFVGLRSIFESKEKNTNILYLADKEETASVGSTGADSFYLENVFSYLIRELKSKESVYDIFRKSKAISGDVTSAFDPDYKNIQDDKNAVYIGRGVVIEKYNGWGGKYQTVDAEPKFVRELIDLYDQKKINWQTGHLGKVDEGGGGTISAYLAKRNVEVIDMGPALFNMHAPYELVSKGDLYSGYLAYKAFLED